MSYIIFGIIFTVFFILFIVIDDFTDRLIDWLLGLVGINSGQVEMLSIEVKERGQRFAISLKNEGKLGVKLAAVIGIDGEGRKFHPIPYLREGEVASVTEKHARRKFSRTSIRPNQMIDVFLDGNEIIAKKYKSMSILDARGNSKFIPEGN